MNVASAIIKNSAGEYLVSRKKKHGLYCFPGGKVEKGETFKEALIRECQEELDITPVDIGESMWYCDVAGDETESGIPKRIYFFLVEKYLGEIKNLEPHKHYDWVFLSPLNLLKKQCVAGVYKFINHDYDPLDIGYI